MSKKRKTSETSEVEFEYTGIEVKDDVPRYVTIVRFHSSVIEVGDYTFGECKQLKKLVLNEGLRKIGCSSFYSHNLEFVKFPSTLIEIASSAFSCCRGLREVVLNETLKTIGEYAFASCVSLESITIPPTVTEISESTFFNCPRLSEVGLHEGIQKISSNAFEGCSSLERFTFPTLSARLETIIQAGEYEDVENKIDEIRCIVERRGSEMLVSDKRLVQGRNWGTLRGVFARIDRLLTYYELKEATTLLELAMWKSKIDQASTNGPIYGDEYRIDIPGPVKNNILSYLNFRV